MEHLPATGVEVVLASRSAPALPVARLRARGELIEEVLAGHPEDVRRFPQRTAILPRLCGDCVRARSCWRSWT